MREKEMTSQEYTIENRRRVSRMWENRRKRWAGWQKRNRVVTFTKLLGALQANDTKEIEKNCEKLGLPIDKSKLSGIISETKE